MTGSSSGLGLSASVPRSATEARDLLASRVSAVARVTGAIALGFDLLNLIVFAASHGVEAAVRMASSAGGLFEIGTGTTLLVLGVFIRRARASMAALVILDGLVTLVASGGFASIIPSIPLDVRPELVALLVTTYVLVGRAAIVPSTGRRTLLVGLVAALPVVAVTFFAYRGGSSEAAAAAVRRTAYVAQWGLVALIVSALLSRRMGGLERKVEEARRLGQYTLEEKIGEGGMGEVYRARHAFLRRPTAVKILPLERTQAEGIERFEREVQLTSQLTHPCTIQIYDFGRTDDGTFYYAMEFVDGITLEELVASFGAQPAGRVVRILADICGSLAEAHGLGLVHRDIKPQNVMLTTRGGVHDAVKVLDFGLVKSRTADSVTGDRSNEVVRGTPAYMAPEAIASPGAVDARTDLYAVGAVGYYLLAGAPVFSGASMIELCAHHLHTEPVPPSLAAGHPVPADVEALVLACLAKSPAARPQSARELRARLLATEAARVGFGEEEASRFWAELRAGRAPRVAESPARRVLLAATDGDHRRGGALDSTVAALD